MITSFADNTTRDVFLGAWAFSQYPDFQDKIEDFFWDLMLIDASATLDDLRRAFGDRINLEGFGGEGGIVLSPIDSTKPGSRAIAFVWTGGNKHNVRSWEVSEQEQGRNYG